MGKLTSKQVIGFIEEQCRVPEGRDVGKPVVLRDWQKAEIANIYDNPAGTRRAIVTFGRKNGKGLALDTPIPTPDGWRTMGDLNEGDYVYGSNGKPVRVSFVSDIHTDLDCWRVTFSDGSSVIADEQHQWVTKHSFKPWKENRVNGSGNGGRAVTEIVTTPQIAQSVLKPRKDGGIEYNHKIDIAPAIQGKQIDLPIPPYTLGAWLGDGTSATASFTVSHEDLQHLCDMLELELGKPMTLYLPENKAATVRATGTGLQAMLRANGLLNNKHIPDVYFDASKKQRWLLLQGLMDTDGTASINKNNGAVRCSFCSTSKVLAEGVWRLARSLGLKATLKERDAKLNGVVVSKKYDVAFTASNQSPVFALPRKQARLKDNIGARSKTLAIVGCEPVESVPTKCIQVDADDSMFLCGHGCVPTHNTALCAFLLLSHLVGPAHRRNSQLYSAAQSRDQAAILFGLAAKIVRMSPALSEFVTVKDSAKMLVCLELGTTYRALSADASTAYGLSPVFVVHDELGQVKGPRSELYDALETASAAHDNPLSIIISTQAATNGDLLSLLIDDAKTQADQKVVLSMYSAPDDADPFSEETIKLANPAFGDFQNAEEVMAMAETAKRLPSAEAGFRNLILNQRVEARNPFVSRKVWDANGSHRNLNGVIYGGLDLSTVNDLTALVLVDSNYAVHCEFWLPEHGIAEKSQKDRVPYDVWAEQGHLILTPGKSIEYEWVAHRLRELFDEHDIKALAFDRWGMKHLQPWLIKAGFSEGEVEKFAPFGQGFRDMSPALRELESVLLNEKMAHNMHPVLRMCAANAVVQQDPAGNRKLAKDKSSGRIDGMVALAMAVGAMAKLSDEPEVIDLDAFLNDPIIASY